MSSPFCNFVVIICIACVFLPAPTKSNFSSRSRANLELHLRTQQAKANSPFDTSICSQRKYSNLMKEIKSYDNIVQKIAETVVGGPFEHLAYEELTEFLDNFGPRLAGSKALENSIDYIEQHLKGVGRTAWMEEVPVPQWERGEEHAQMLTPKNKKLAILGLGQSTATPPEGITAQALVFDSYDELVTNTSELAGKIAVCNYVGAPGEMLDTKQTGYPEIADFGALAVLYRSAASFSLYSPHTRRSNLYYNQVSKEIPIAYMAIEDIELLSRIHKRGQTIQLHLTLTNNFGSNLTTSRNLLWDMKGSKLPEEHIIVSAHTDSWDISAGAQDDGIGISLVVLATKLLKYLNLSPKRTVRSALWTAEEYGFNGSMNYIQSHRNSVASNLTAVMEADYACLANAGWIFHADYKNTTARNNMFSHTELGCIMQGVTQLVGPNLTFGLVYQSDTFGTDLDRFRELQVPVVSLLGDDGRYFWFHHTEADTVSALDRQQLDYCLVSWTAMTYILADIQMPEEIGDGDENEGGSGNGSRITAINIIPMTLFVTMIIDKLQ